jgi:translocation and assembly module TamB
MKRLLKALSWLLLLLFLCLLLLVFILTTKVGTKALAGLSNRYFSDWVQTEAVDGSLLTGLSAKQFVWQGTKERIVINNLIFEPDMGDLLEKQLHIKKLHADKILVELAASSDDGGQMQAINLPLAIKVDQLNITQLDIVQRKGSTEETQQTINNINVSANAEAERLFIKHFNAAPLIDGKPLQLKAEGDININAPYTLDGNLRFDYQHPEHGEATGRFILAGDIQQYTLKGQASLDSPAFHLLNLQLSGEGSQERVNINELAFKGFEGTANGEANIAWKDALTWTASINTKGIKTEKLMPEWPAELTATFSTKGQTHNEKLQAEVRLDSLEGSLQTYPLTANGLVNIAGDSEKMDIDIQSLDVTAFDGKGSVQGEVTLAGKAIYWDATLKTDNIKTDRLLPDWPATITSVLVSKGEYIDQKPKLTAQIERLDGNVMGNPLAAQGLITVDDQNIQIKNLKARSGKNTLDVNGKASEPFDLAWSLQGNNLSQVLKDLQGQLSGSGQLQGTIKQPQVSATLKGQGIRYQDYRLAAIDMDVEQNKQQFMIDGNLQKLQIAEETIDSIEIKGDGKLEKHKLALQLAHTAGNVNLHADGGWENETWQGSLKQFTIQETDVGNWRLNQAMNVKASQKQVQTSDFCLQNQQASVCANRLEWREKKGIKTSGALKNIPFSLFKPWLPDDITLPGNIQADFAIDQQNDKPKGTVNIHLPDNQFTINTGGGEAETLRYKNTRLQATLNNRLLKTQLQAEIDDKGTINADAAITLKPESGQHTLAGKAKINLPDISWLEAEIPAIKKLQGSVVGNINVAGQLEQPQIKGDIRLQNTRFELPETGTTIEQVNLNIQASRFDKASINGSLKAGKGTLMITGQASLPQQGHWQADLKLKGQQLQFMDTYEIQGQVSPDLNIQASPNAIRVTGTLTVPETNITLNELPHSAVYESDDVVIVGQSTQARQLQKQRQKQQSLPMNIQPDVNIVLGDKVNLSGFGLDTRLEGRLRIIQPKHVIIAQGNLKTVDGVYKAYGQALNIERGNLVFNGPLSNPGLDLQAVRDSDEVIAGIQLSGTANKPESRLFSIPTMSQNDILSYLLTGRRFSEASGSEGNMLLNAVTSLGITGGESIARQLGNTVGLDTVNIKSGEDGKMSSSELELGKKLGPNLYLKYIVGIFDSAQKAAIEYQFNKRLRLEAESGLHQGFDLIYRVERD